jgi:serine/threonine protein kinase/formylglycine-generating enzyme required for sulfatase activity
MSDDFLSQIDARREAYKEAWDRGEEPKIENYLGDTVGPHRSLLFEELLKLDLEICRQHGQKPVLEDYARQREHIELAKMVFLEAGCLPLEWTERYRVEKVLGRGGFGTTYLAYDKLLNYRVAIKVPHRELVSACQNADAYLDEARMAVGLNHPNIVRVLNVGGTEYCPCFVVFEFIDGCTLAQKIKNDPLSIKESVEIVATVAEALSHAHRQLVHRDVKPGNILLDSSGKPHLADFGLALREENVGHGARYVGTPAYMSPEQARSEGHRVDGRSDIFSLGVVLYELLAGRQPFRGKSKSELSQQITSIDPWPLRQINPQIPKELDRICSKSLAKRAAERYMSAMDMAHDLRHFDPQQTIEDHNRSAEDREQTPELPVPPATPPDSHRVEIIPKGLRAFDERDAQFFPDLLPGPRDRDGLPDSILFWKTRIEETDPENTFAVGLIYGPSGCGKSSLVRAGLIPRLSKDVLTIYVQATADNTENQLLKGMQKRCPALPAGLSLKETLAVLRRGQSLLKGKKVLLVLDQFEQWLHARREEDGGKLVQALRQCDGGHLQCIVMVRADFWLAICRFMHVLEIRVVEGENSRLVDLFDPRHAKKVLTDFGRAFKALSEIVTEDQDAFLDQAVSSLSQDGKIICVRLALFAEMVKGKPWTLKTLIEVGGIEGVGVRFLEETFVSPMAPPLHRRHERAARNLLKALLPEPGTNIKGHMRSQQDLLEKSDYASRPDEFEELIDILDGELHLITPSDPEGVEKDEGRRTKEGTKPGQGDLISDSSPSPRPSSHTLRYYQLTHDYLIPSLREWLTRKQKDDKQGRAEILLEDLAAVWNVRREQRFLPSLHQWVTIRLWTQKRRWKEPERKMMQRAGRYHRFRVGIVAAFLLLAGWGLWEGSGYEAARQRVGQLTAAETVDVETYRERLRPYRRWARPQLQRLVDGKADDKTRLHVALALVDGDSSQLNHLMRILLDALLKAPPEQLIVLRDLLAEHAAELSPPLWEVLLDVKEPLERRLHAAGALALYAPLDQRWSPPLAREVTGWLMREDLFHLSFWNHVFQPAGAVLIQPLSEVFHNPKASESERTTAAVFLAAYVDEADRLADLLMDGNEKQFASLFPKFKAHRPESLPQLRREFNRKSSADELKHADLKEKIASRQANAAVALLKMGQEQEVWPLLKHSEDPRVRSYLIHRLGPSDVDAELAKLIVKRLTDEHDISIKRALLLSLGEFGEQELALINRASLVNELLDLYCTNPDAGVHGAVEWLLRQWKQKDQLKQLEKQWANNVQERDDRLKRINEELIEGRKKSHPEWQCLWYVNSQAQTMIVIPGRQTFSMGSPESHPERKRDEPVQQRRIIDYTFALAAKSVTVEQFLRFPKGRAFIPRNKPDPECPVNWMTWDLVPEYCNWLSTEEGLPEEEWCYKCNKEGVLKLVPDYLKRTGYRLPTEAEWECACRAGAVTTRYYGESVKLLEKYAWYVWNSNYRTWPVGSLKPNDWGLFDMHGNVWNWCHEEGEESAEPRLHPIRGGAFLDAPADVRAACRIRVLAERETGETGIRPARTIR